MMIQDLLEQAFAQRRETRQAEWEAVRKDGGFGASDVGKQCLRIPLLNERHEPTTNPATPGRQDRFDSGHWLEGYLLDLIAGACDQAGLGNIYRQAEASLPPFYAHTDGLLIGRPDGAPSYPIEIKSVHVFAFDQREKELRAQGITKFMPYPEHALQLAQFIHLCDLVGTPVSPLGTIVYIDLNFRRRYCEVDAKELYPELNRRMAELVLYKNLGELPPRLVDSTKYPCKGCSHFDYCWKPQTDSSS